MVLKLWRDWPQTSMLIGNKNIVNHLHLYIVVYQYDSHMHAHVHTDIAMYRIQKEVGNKIF